MNSTTDTIKIKRLVLVDSAGFCFIEIPIDRHAILLGKGNIGKSSLLNSLRLFLLPENNFNKSQIKFAFREPKKNDYYSNNDSYRHYFPSNRSFLILESENEAGTHCQILYKTTNLGYGRIFTPFSFDKIRRLFWDGSGDEDGIGRAVAELSIAHIKDSLKKLSSKTEVISDIGKLRQTLYAEPNELLDSDKTRYCLVPLHKVDEANIESLRALILLLFEMDASVDSMAQALANIIESGKKTTDDILDFDIDAFLAKHNNLKQQQSHIVELRNLEPEFNTLSKRYERYIKLSESDKSYIAYTHALLEQEPQLKQQALESQKELSQQEEIKKGYKKSLQAIHDELIGERRLLKQGEKDRKEQGETIEKTTLLQAQYPDYSLVEIKDVLQQYIEDKTKELDALQTTEGNIQLRAELEEKIRKQEERIFQIESSLANEEFQLLQQLPTPTKTVLSAINKKLIIANPQRKITEEERQTINSFTALFKDNEATLKWFDQELDKNIVDAKDEIQKDLAEIKQDLSGDQKTYKNISIEKDAISQKKVIESIKRDIKSSENDIKSIDAHPRRSDMDKNIRNIEQCEATIEKLVVKEANYNAKFEPLRSKLVELIESRDYKNKAVSDLNSLKGNLNSLKMRYSQLKALSLDDIQTKKIDSVTEENVEQLEIDLHEFDRLRTEIKAELQGLHHREFINEPELLSQSPNDSVIGRGINQLRDTFNDLDNTEKAYKDYLHSHNESVASYKKVLKDNYELIHRFESSINQELSTVTINDLTEIKASIAVHPKFRHLVDEINKLDEHGDVPLSDQFYERLKVFVETFFKDGDAKLTMDKIITNLEYKTRKEKDDAMQDKAQSMSTTVLINLELVKILLKRVIPTGVRLEMPLIFDEAADINIDQFDWILPNLSQAGFSLFAAATHSVSTELIHKIGVYFSVDEMTTSQPYDSKRTLVFWNGGEGFESVGSDNLMDLALADQTDWVDQSE